MVAYWISQRWQNNYQQSYIVYVIAKVIILNNYNNFFVKIKAYYNWNTMNIIIEFIEYKTLYKDKLLEKEHKDALHLKIDIVKNQISKGLVIKICI